MTTIPGFDIATDLKVEFYLPDEASNLFIIGVSKLGGDDVLAGAGLFTIGSSLLGGDDVLGDNEFFAFTWQDLGCVVSNCNLSLGGQVRDSLFFQPSPAQAQITIQSFDYDPSYNSAFRPGTQVRVKLVKDEIDFTLFRGVIDNIGGTYFQSGVNKLDIKALDKFKQYINSRLPLLDTTTDFPEGYVTPYEQLEVIAEALGTAMHESSEPTVGELPSTLETEVIPSTAIYDAIQVGLGLFWIDQATQEFVFIPRPVPTSIPEGTMVIGNNHGEPNHLCMSEIVTDASQDVVFNSLRVELKDDADVFTVKENQDLIDLYGKFAQDVTLNTTDLTELERWAEAAFNQSPTNLVSSIETPAKNRLGTLTEAAFFYPGELVGVKYSQGVLDIDDYYTITRVSHTIDVDNWFTTLDLWKEA
jgi:hypothetical protein